MNTTRTGTPSGPDLAQLVQDRLRGRRALLATGLLALPALWLGGPWLLAAGAVPLLASVAPCLAMCALGLCTMRACNQQGSAGAAAIGMSAPASALAVAPLSTGALGEANALSPRP